MHKLVTQLGGSKSLGIRCDTRFDPRLSVPLPYGSVYTNNWENKIDSRNKEITK